MRSDPEAKRRSASNVPSTFIARLAVPRNGTWQRINCEQIVVSGVRAIPAQGHRVGHISNPDYDPVFLEYEQALCSSEADAETARISGQRLIEQAIAGEAVGVGSHFLVRNVGRIHQDNAKNTWHIATPIM